MQVNSICFQKAYSLVSCGVLAPSHQLAQWGMAERAWVTVSFLGKQLWRPASRYLMCVFIGIYAYITQSAQVTASCCPIRSNDTQLMLCECVRSGEGSLFRQCVCRQRSGSSQCPGLWLQIIGSPVNWDSFMSRLVL